MRRTNPRHAMKPELIENPRNQSREIACAKNWNLMILEFEKGINWREPYLICWQNQALNHYIELRFLGGGRKKKHLHHAEAYIGTVDLHSAGGSLLCHGLRISARNWGKTSLSSDKALFVKCGNCTRWQWFWVNFITTSLFSLTGIMVSKGNHPKMALIQGSEIFYIIYPEWLTSWHTSTAWISFRYLGWWSPNAPCFEILGGYNG